MHLYFYRKLALIGAVSLFMVWVVIHLRQSPMDDPDWIVRFTLGALLSFALLAGKPVPGRRRSKHGFFEDYPKALPALAVFAALLSVTGMIATVRQFEWLGIVLLLYAALRWALPPLYRVNVARALFLFYWIHPLPGQVFGPFQMWMQRLSVIGGEWLLHILNYRVWADGFILRLGTAEFGVPEACSGMRTAVTVLICTLGVGMLMRMRWHETFAFLVLGTAQVLALNILRIGVIVHIAMRGNLSISENVLHDTAGIFLLISIALVQLEMVWWHSYIGKRRAYRQAVRAGNAERLKQSSFLPPLWHFAARWVTLALAVALLAAGVAGAAYKRRPSHRAAMIKEVSAALLHEHPALAERGSLAALALTPGDRELKTLRIQALVRGEKYDRALIALDELPGALSPLERALKSASLAAEGRLTEAAQAIESVPEDMLRNIPILSISRAEYAAMIDEPAVVAEYALYASRSHVTVPRVRALYPYLARRGKWRAIADTHHDLPYRNIEYALLAIHANQAVNRMETVDRIMRQAHEEWPDEIRLLLNMAQLAAYRPGGAWEETFESALLEKIEELDTDRLSTLIGHAFEMSRPDIAWLLWRRLEELDAGDPGLFFTAARHAGNWFVFRRRQVGMSAVNELDMVDMRDTYLKRRDEPGFMPYWNRVPLVEEMTAVPVAELRTRYLRRTLEEIESRRRAGAMTQRFERMYPVVLGILGRTAEAHEELRALAVAYPELEPEILMQHALNYERRAEWQQSYEKLRRLMDIVEFPPLQVRLMYMNATLNMGLGQLALRTAMDAAAEFTESADAQIALAVCWEAFGFSEQALFILARVENSGQLPFYPQLLLDTGRYRKARRLARVSGVSLREERQGRAARVMPAEAIVMRRQTRPMTPESMAEAADFARETAASSESPFLAKLRGLEAEWFAAAGEGIVSDAERWFDAGRDSREQAAAAYSLAVLLLRRGDADAAGEVVGHALRRMPDCAVLWRLRISLSGGDPDLVGEAYERFPNDPDFWLAYLITRLRADVAAAREADEIRAWALREIQSAVGAQRFAPGQMVRAADYLLRNNLPEAAAVAARYAIEKGEGLETAYVVGLRSALKTQDVRWALSCALGGADHARDPAPFYQMLVNLNFASGTLDRDLVLALNYLKEQFPRETTWAEQLGYVHFRQGDPGRALGMLSPIIRVEDLPDVQVATFALAAEAARLEKRVGHAVSILESALRNYPGNRTLLNNLVYTMVHDPEMQARALEYLPELARMAGDHAETLDTIALVYLRNGQLPRAEFYLEKALKNIRQEDYAYPYIQMTRAKLLAAQGDAQAGLQILRQIVANQDYPAPVRGEIRERMMVIARTLMERQMSVIEQSLDIEEPEAILKALDSAMNDPRYPLSLRDEFRHRARNVGNAVLARKLRHARDLMQQNETEAAGELLREILRSPYIGEDTGREARNLQHSLL